VKKKKKRERKGIRIRRAAGCKSSEEGNEKASEKGESNHAILFLYLS